MHGSRLSRSILEAPQLIAPSFRTLNMQPQRFSGSEKTFLSGMSPTGSAFKCAQRLVKLEKLSTVESSHDCRHGFELETKIPIRLPKPAAPLLTSLGVGPNLTQRI